MECPDCKKPVCQECGDCGCCCLPSKWISVKDRLPPEGELVLTHRPTSLDLRMEVDYLVYFEDGEKTWSCTRDKEQNCITHWMPLPQPPKVSHSAPEGSAQQEGEALETEYKDSAPQSDS